MRLPRRERSGNLRDQRGQSGGGLGRSGLPQLPIPMGGRGAGGLIGILFVLAILFFAGRGVLGGDGGGFGIDPPSNFPQAPAPNAGSAPDADAPLVQFVNDVLVDAQELWAKQFDAAGRTYENADLVLFTSAVRSGCGVASSATGPFYCPLDKTVYLDLGFFRELDRRFGAPGDFAQAYVIAHELGHHVQNLLGINPAVRRAQQENPGEANELSIRQELQADCLAGVWGHSTYERGFLDPGDVQEGLNAAAAVGDDRLGASPESWTHGSAAQRRQWFSTGFDTGDTGACDTFA